MNFEQKVRLLSGSGGQLLFRRLRGALLFLGRDYNYGFLDGLGCLLLLLILGEQDFTPGEYSNYGLYQYEDDGHGEGGQYEGPQGGRVVGVGFPGPPGVEGPVYEGHHE